MPGAKYDDHPLARLRLDIRQVIEDTQIAGVPVAGPYRARLPPICTDLCNIQVGAVHGDKGVLPVERQKPGSDAAISQFRDDTLDCTKDCVDARAKSVCTTPAVKIRVLRIPRWWAIPVHGVHPLEA